MSGVLTGMASAITYNGIGLSSLGEYKLNLKGEVDRFRTLDEPTEKAVLCFKEWEADLTIEGDLPARSYGVVTAGGWDGAYLKEWGVEITCQEDEVPAQQLPWKLRSIAGLSWKVDSTRWVLSATNGLFLRAVANSDGTAVSVVTPVLSGLAVYGETGQEFKPSPQEETLSLEGSGAFTAGAYWANLVGILAGYRTQLLSSKYVEPGSIVFAGVGTGLGYITKLSAKSDGKRVKIDASLASYGEPTFT